MLRPSDLAAIHAGPIPRHARPQANALQGGGKSCAPFSWRRFAGAVVLPGAMAERERSDPLAVAPGSLLKMPRNFWASCQTDGLDDAPEFYGAWESFENSTLAQGWPARRGVSENLPAPPTIQSGEHQPHCLRSGFD